MVIDISSSRYRLLLVISTILGAVVAGTYTYLGTQIDSFEGLLPYGGSEEAMYLIRTQEALVRPFTNVTNGVFQGPSGLQSAGAEQVIGALFWWTGLSAPWLVFFLHVLISPLALPLSAALSRKVGASRILSLAAGIFLFWAFVYCRRLFHGGFSIPLVLATLLLMWQWYERPTIKRAIMLGVPLGFAVGVYLWAWTFLWTTVSLLFLGSLFDREKRAGMIRTAFPLAASVLLFAYPSLHHLVTARLHPHYDVAAFRAGLAFTRYPESIPRSILTVAVCVVAIWILRKREHRRALLPLFAMLASLAVMYNQQLLHGTVMSFSSHYIQYVTLSFFLLILACFVRKIRTPLSIAMTLVCLGVIALNTHDSGGRLVAFQKPIPDAMRTQHLKDAVEYLKGVPVTTVLTDRITADIVASYTAHDVAFTEYSAFVLTSDEEYWDRACLSELFSPTPVHYETLVVHAEERLRVLRKQETETEYEISLQKAYARCTDVRRDPKPVLQKYGVTLLLWDQEQRPDWLVDSLLFTQITNGSGWSLWALR